MDATLWIAILGADPLPMPTIAADLVPLATRLKVGILLENGTELRDGNPAKRWLVGP